MMSMESASVVNTNSFCEEDLTTFLECSERIQQCEKRQRREWLKKAVKTAEEIFEGNPVTDDDLLKQGTGDLSYASYTPSMEDLLKYFEEDVEVDIDQPQEAEKPVVELPKAVPNGDVLVERTIKPSEVKQREIKGHCGEDVKREIVENAMKKFEGMRTSAKPIRDLWGSRAILKLPQGQVKPTDRTFTYFSSDDGCKPLSPSQGKPEPRTKPEEPCSSSTLRNRELRRQFLQLNEVEGAKGAASPRSPIPSDLVPCVFEPKFSKPSSIKGRTPTPTKLLGASPKVPKKQKAFNFSQRSPFGASNSNPAENFSSRFMSLRGPKPYAGGQQTYLTPRDLNITQEEWEERYFNLIRKDRRPATLPKPEIKHRAEAKLDVKPELKPEMQAKDVGFSRRLWEEKYTQIVQPDPKPVEVKTTPRKQTSFQTPVKREHEELQSKWEKPLQVKTPKKSKVQKMAEMFNGMISQMVKRESTKYAYDRLTNEVSPQPPQPKIRTITPVQQRTPVASPRVSPKPNPRSSVNNQAGCLIPEDAFNKLCVKDKVLLFNKFVREMTRRNPNFTLETKDSANGTCCSPSLVGKLESVKCLARELEAKMEFPKQTVSEAALGKSPGSLKKRQAPQPPVQDAAMDENDSIHVSTLTVVLKPSPNKPDAPEDPIPPEEHPIPKKKVMPLTVVHCPTAKRSCRQLHSAIPIDMYAPPRKIRRTRPERNGIKSLFQSPRIEKLFYDWMKERHGHSFDIRASKPNSPVNVAKEEEEAHDETLINEEPRVTADEPQSEKPATSDCKSADPSESDSSSLFSMPKSKSATDESQGENIQEATAEFEFLKPVRPPRKKKVKRTTLTWKKDASIVEKLPVSTTDSDSDFKAMEAQAQQLQKLQKPTHLFGENNDQPIAKKLIFSDIKVRADQEALDAEEDFLNFMNSPRRVRDAYTLTVMSSPSQNAESVSSGGSEKPPAKPPRMGKPPSVTAQLPANIDESKFENEDQGFETASNEFSPARTIRRNQGKKAKLEKSPLFIKLNLEMMRRMSEADQIPSAASTPIKNNTNSPQTKVTPVKRSAWHTVFSPIQNGTRRRTSWIDNESRRSSVLMDVIREERHSNEPQQQPQTKLPPSPDLVDEVFEPSTPPSDVAAEKPSSFWISIGDITISLGIFENPEDRLSLLYDIFCQKSAEVRQVFFGIDDFKYSARNVISRQEITKILPKVDEVSHYWFASGDLCIPFQGNSISPETITRIFTFIKDTSAKGSRLAFGVDDFEFSKIPDPFSNSSKLSMESNYGMLIGLNSQKFTWSHSTQNSTQNTPQDSPFKTSDFDPSEVDSDSLEQTELGRLSFSPYGSNYFDMLSMRSGERTSVTSFGSAGSPEIFSFEYENEPLDKMFNLRRNSVAPNGTYSVEKQQKAMPKPLPPTESMTIDKMIEIIHRQQNKLKNIESNMKSYPKPITPNIKYKGPPPTVKKLHDIVKSIQIIAKDGFEDCSPRQLESFMYFLTLHAETCLTTCSDHMNKIMDKLMDEKTVKI